MLHGAAGRIERATKRPRAGEDDALTAAIASVHGRQIFDARGRPTFEVEYALADGQSPGEVLDLLVEAIALAG
jgi:hypothetical protein